MNFGKIEKPFRTCPRCGMKSLRMQDSCPDCGLVFARLEIATNKDAKRLIKKRETDFIIKTKKLPKDVNYYKLLAITIFGGIFGAHCFRVGRYWRGGILLLNFLLLVSYVIFNDKLIAYDGGALVTVLATIGGLVMLIWVYDMLMVGLKKFKVPVAIDLDAELAQQEEHLDDEKQQTSVETDDKQEDTVEQLKDVKVKNKRVKKEKKLNQKEEDNIVTQTEIVVEQVEMDNGSEDKSNDKKDADEEGK